MCGGGCAAPAHHANETVSLPNERHDVLRKSLIALTVAGGLALGVTALAPVATSQVGPPTATRLVTAPGGGSPNAEIADATVSADGNWLVFSSLATNLTDDPDSGFSEIYAMDTTTGAVTLLTKIPEGGGPSDGDSFEPAVCGDGSVVAFATEAELLDPVIDDDFNGEFDVYVVLRDNDGNGVFDEYDVPGGVRITRVSVGFEGLEADFGAVSPAISADCSTVGFVALDPLADNDLNDFEDVYVRDITDLPEEVFDFDAPERVSVGTDPTSLTTGGGQLPALSADGNLVSFISTGNGLVAGADAARGGVFIRDRAAGVTSHVSVRATGGASNGAPDGSAAPAMTPDGRCVAFRFNALDLAPGVVNNQGVFVRDRVAGTTTLVSKSNQGIQATEAGNPALSDDCRFVGFDSGDPGLVLGDTNGARDAFVHDLVTGGTDAVSRKADGTVAAGGSSVRQLLAGRRAIVNSSAPEILGADGGDGLIDPFEVPFGNLGFASAGFTDVPPSAFFEQGVAWLKFHDITGGQGGPGRYTPAGPVNRAQMAAFMWRMMGEPAAAASCGFRDEASIPAFARPGACWLLENGITTNNPYNPTGVVNRGQMAAFL